jgi:hypothetical protein
MEDVFFVFPRILKFVSLCSHVICSINAKIMFKLVVVCFTVLITYSVKKKLILPSLYGFPTQSTILFHRLSLLVPWFTFSFKFLISTNLICILKSYRCGCVSDSSS